MTRTPYIVICDCPKKMYFSEGPNVSPPSFSYLKRKPLINQNPVYLSINTPKNVEISVDFERENVFIFFYALIRCMVVQ